MSVFREVYNITDLGDMQLSFGVRKSSTTSNGSTLKVEVSSDGTTWTTLTIPALPTGTGTAGWHYVTASGNIPATSNLHIRFTHLGSVSVIFRIDDVKLIFGSGTPSGFSVANRELEAQYEEQPLVQKDAFEVFPNPAHSRINVRWKGVDGQATLQIASVKGEEVFRRKIPLSQLATVDVSHLARGVYIITLTAGSEKAQRKIVIQ